MKRFTGYRWNYSTLIILLFACMMGNLFGGWADKLTQHERFRLGVQDVKTIRWSELHHNLIAVTPSNTSIVWGKGKHKGKVLVTSFMPSWFVKLYLNEKVVERIKSERFRSGNRVYEMRMHLDEEARDVIKKLTFEDGKKNPDVPPKFKHSMRGTGVAWVSVVPQAQYFLAGRKETGNDLKNRCDELAGLEPSKENVVKFFVEQWVDPKDLYRATFDPQIFDRSIISDQVDQGFLEKQRKAISVDIFSKHFLRRGYQKDSYKYAKKPDQQKDSWKTDWLRKSDEEEKSRYSHWFNGQKDWVQTDPDPMPWTSLGYTYDYSVEAFNSHKSNRHVGLAEFCIKPGSEVQIEGIYSIGEYAKLWEKRREGIEGRVRAQLRKNIKQMQSEFPEFSKDENRAIKIGNLLAKMKAKDLFVEGCSDFRVFLGKKKNTSFIKEALEKIHKGAGIRINAYNDYLAIKEKYRKSHLNIEKGGKSATKAIFVLKFPDYRGTVTKAKEEMRDLMKLDTRLRYLLKLCDDFLKKQLQITPKL